MNGLVQQERTISIRAVFYVSLFGYHYWSLLMHHYLGIMSRILMYLIWNEFSCLIFVRWYGHQGKNKRFWIILDSSAVDIFCIIFWQFLLISVKNSNRPTKFVHLFSYFVLWNVLFICTLQFQFSIISGKDSKLIFYVKYLLTEQKILNFTKINIDLMTFSVFDSFLFLFFSRRIWRFYVFLVIETTSNFMLLLSHEKINIF